MDVNNILAIVRRIAEAIAEGRIEASAIKTMSDDELAAYDDELNGILKKKQQEAEALAE